MRRTRWFLSLSIAVAGVSGVVPAAFAQFGFGGRSDDIELVERYDTNADGYLNRAERDVIRGRRSTSLPVERADSDSVMSPDDVRVYGDEALYDPNVLRTLFIDFEYPDWESELEYFYGTDVDVSATVTVDRQVYPDVGIHFRGNTSFRNVPAGRKRGLNLSFNFIDSDQRLLGYRTLNLLNGYGDPTFLRNVLYLHIANQYYPAPKANFARVVINGQDWGIYVNVQQFNSDFTREAHDTNEARWRVPGSFNSRGGLEYLGDNVSAYRREYAIKNKDRPESWDALIELTRVLNRTPPERLVDELEPILDIDEALRFLAVDIALLNSDGYWSRNSDYSIYLDEDGRFHVTAYDVNEAMQASSGFGGFRRRGGGGGVTVSPLEGSRETAKALLLRLLAVPELRERYFDIVRDVAENWLDWQKLEPVAQRYRQLIADEVAVDTRKLYSTSAFDTGFNGGAGLKAFIDARQQYLLSWLDANAGSTAQ